VTFGQNAVMRVLSCTIQAW